MYIPDVHPKRPAAWPGYFLGRPGELYRRRYRPVHATIASR